MAAKMQSEMPSKMLTKGIAAVLTEEFQEGPCFVLQLQIRHVHSATVVATKTENKSIGCKIQKFLTFIGAKNQDKLETHLLPGLIEKKLPQMMTEMMSEKMAGKGVKAEARVLPEPKQSKCQEEKTTQIGKAAQKLES